MTEIKFRRGWRRHDPQLIDDARQFWRDMDVMSPEDIEARTKELCALAYVDGKIAAVSTAAPYDFPRLRARFAYYRTLIAPDYRRQRLAVQLCVYSRDVLAAWARENPEMKIKGLFMAFQAEEFHKHPFVPVERRPGIDFILVGYTPTGDRMRVTWFDGVTVE